MDAMCTNSLHSHYLPWATAIHFLHNSVSIQSLMSPIHLWRCRSHCHLFLSTLPSSTMWWMLRFWANGNTLKYCNLKQVRLTYSKDTWKDCVWKRWFFIGHWSAWPCFWLHPYSVLLWEFIVILGTTVMVTTGRTYYGVENQEEYHIPYYRVSDSAKKIRISTASRVTLDNEQRVKLGSPPHTVIVPFLFIPLAVLRSFVISFRCYCCRRSCFYGWQHCCPLAIALMLSADSFVQPGGRKCVANQESRLDLNDSIPQQ